MARPYTQELRDRVFAAYDRGMKTKQIATIFQVSSAWARRIKQRRRETGETRPRPMGGATVIKIDLQRLRQLVEEQPDATIVELHRRLGADCCLSAVGFALQRLDLTFKKKRCRPRSRTGPTLPRLAISGNSSSLPGTLPA
jgi:transposase